jgi:phosphoglycolate phosphatase
MSPRYVVLFDIDGTLIDAGGAGQAAMVAAMIEEFAASRPVSGISTAGRTDRAIGMDLFQFHGIEPSNAHWARYLQAYFRLLPESLVLRRGEVLPGVKRLIRRLVKSREVRLGLLTGNFAEGARLKLAHYELGKHFDFGGFGDEHLDRDDVARDAFKLVKTRYPDMTPDRVWVVGDTPADIHCARAIGAKVLAVGTGMYSAEDLEMYGPDLLVRNLENIDHLVQAIGLTT